MKKLFTVLFILFVCTTYGQTIPKNAIRINPIVVNPQGDSCYSFTWITNGLGRDTLVPPYLSVLLFGKDGFKLFSYDLYAPASSKWSIPIIDSFIISKNKRLVRR